MKHFYEINFSAEGKLYSTRFSTEQELRANSYEAHANGFVLGTIESNNQQIKTSHVNASVFELIPINSCRSDNETEAANEESYDAFTRELRWEGPVYLKTT